MIPAALLDRPAIVQRVSYLRCACPVCIGLDARYPTQGFQLALFPYEPRLLPGRR